MRRLFPTRSNVTNGFILLLVLFLLQFCSSDYFRLFLASNHIRNKEYDEAINSYQKILRKAQARSDLIIAPSKKDGYTHTKNLLLNTSLSGATWHLKTGKKYKEEGKNTEALREFDTVTRIKKGFSSLLPFRYLRSKEKWDIILKKTYLNSISCFAAENNWDEIIDTHIKILKLGISFEKIDSGKFLGIGLQDKTKETLFANYKKLLEKEKRELLKSELSGIYFKIAEKFEKSNKKKAIRIYRNAIGISPNNKAVLLKMLSLEPENWRYHYLLAKLRTTPLDIARKELEKALHYSPKSYEPYYAMGKLLYSEKNYDGAVNWLKKAISINEKPDIFYTLSEIYAQKGNRAKASEYIRAGYNIEPDKMSQYQLGRHLGKNGFLNYYNSDITYKYTVPPNNTWLPDTTPPRKLISSAKKWGNWVTWNHAADGTEITFDIGKESRIKNIKIDYYFRNTHYTFPGALIYSSSDNKNYKYVGEFKKRPFDGAGFKDDALGTIDLVARYVKVAIKPTKMSMTIRRIEITPMNRKSFWKLITAPSGLF